MQRVAVINIVGLSPSLLGEFTPRINDFASQGTLRTVRPAFPAVTCSAQASYLTGTRPSKHGIVGNGWFDRASAEVRFWKQSNNLVQGTKVWDSIRRDYPGFSCANLFWWFNMYSTVDFSLTPRPLYPADGRKLFDIYTWPYALRTDIQDQLGTFPFPCFWGPAAGLDTPQGPSDGVSRWIARAAEWIETKHQPGLSLIYLPHLDYNLQRLGPDHPEIHRDLKAIDTIVGDLLDFFADRNVRCLLLSEYGITAVTQPIHLNRLFRQEGWLTVKEELGLELLDAGASRAFAVADHQVAHIYVQEPSLIPRVRSLIQEIPGVDQVLDEAGKSQWGVDHERAGDLIAVARNSAWFTYYYWLDDRRAPDFARTIDIHRKPGYDPVELFLDPSIRGIQLKILWRLLQKRLGFRMLMDVIPLDASLVRGSHGAVPSDPNDWPVVISDLPQAFPNADLGSTDIAGIIQRLVLPAE